MDQPQGEWNRIEHNLTLHPPGHPEVGRHMDELREGAKAFAHLVDRLVPAGREKSMALTAVEDACMQAVAGVARHQDVVTGEVHAEQGPSQ